jgi:hypothetical protein
VGPFDSCYEADCCQFSSIHTTELGLHSPLLYVRLLLGCGLWMVRKILAAWVNSLPLSRLQEHLQYSITGMAEIQGEAVSPSSPEVLVKQ